MVGSNNLDWFLTLELSEGGDKSSVFIHHYDVKNSRSVACVDYLSLNGKLF